MSTARNNSGTDEGQIPPAEVYEKLRRQILDGTLAPGSLLTIGPLADELGVSRTPLREALGRLHGEGLVDLERYRRPRVAGFDADELDSIYASRISLESLGIAVTTPLLTNDELDLIDRDLREMEEVEDLATIDLWEQRHRAFHERLISHAPQLIPQFHSLADRSYRYRQVLYSHTTPIQRWLTGRRDHAQLVAACRDRDATRAMRTLAEHLARTALVMMSEIAPTREPEMIRTALRIATSADLGRAR
ncbi:MAG: GntR family transcriptional regulator [Solirubrobacterales bacterium]|nr:GntR family transcriptional regulator [Solirubrobacterales bacterium]